MSGPNDSTTGGPLLPTAPLPIEDAELENFFNSYLVGLTGLDPNLVIMNWQPEEPSIPPAGSVWISYAFFDEYGDLFPYQAIAADGKSSTVQQHEIFTVLARVYSTGEAGGARSLAKQIRAGLALAQNRDPLRAAGMGLVECGPPQPVPVLVKNLWLYRMDLPIKIRRVLVYTYPVKSLESVGAGLHMQAQNVELTRTLNIEEKT